MVGDIVNLSARLMAAAKTGILTDHDTYEGSKSTIIFEKLDPIKVKGKNQKIPKISKQENSLKILKFHFYRKIKSNSNIRTCKA